MRDIPNYAGYKATKSGKIWSDRSKAFLKPWKTRYGYMRVTIARKTVFVHRLVAMAYVDNPLNKPHVNHIDCDRSNNKAVNLEWCTPKENTAHSIAMRTKVSGERHNFAKLTLNQVNEIRERVKNGEKAKDIHSEYGVSYVLVWQIVNRKVWKYA